MHHGWYEPGMAMGSGWMIGLHGLFWVVVLGLLIVFAVVLIRRLNGRPGGGRGTSALEMLEARYARGEIDRDEFLQRKKDLS